jgi:hypothetical protein
MVRRHEKTELALLAVVWLAVLVYAYNHRAFWDQTLRLFK